MGVDLSERKSGTERTKKRKKLELVYLSPPGGATDTMVHRLAHGFFQSCDNILQTDRPTWQDQMAILYYEIHRFRVVYVPGYKDAWLPSRLSST